MAKKRLKLYIWTGVFCDYTCGMAAVIAHNVAEARELLDAQFGYHPGDIDKEPVEVDLSKTDTEPQAWYVYGGG